MLDETNHNAGSVELGDTSKRVGMEVIRERGVNPKELREKLIDAIGAEFTTYYYYTNLRMHLADEEESTPQWHFARGEPSDAPYSTNNRFNDSA